MLRDVSFMASFFEAFAAAVFVVDGQGDVTYWNRGAETIFGRAQREAAGAQIDDLGLVPDDSDADDLRAALAAGRGDGPMVLMRANRDRVTVFVAQAAAEGMLGGGAVVTVAVELTDRVQIDDQLLALRAAVAEDEQPVVVTEAHPLDAPWGPPVIHVNDAFTRVTGYAAGEVIGFTPRILQGPGSDRSTLDRVRRALERQEQITVEILNYKKDGSEYRAQMSLTPIFEPGGTCTHWVSVQRELAPVARPEPEEEARPPRASMEGCDIFTALVADGSDVITVLDENAVITYVSPSVERVLGYSRGSVLGARAFDFIHRDDVEALRQAFDSQLATPDPGRELSFRVHHADGSWRQVQGMWRSLADEPALDGVVLTARDVTESERLADLLACEDEVLRMISADQPLEATLETLLLGMQRVFEGVICSLVLVEEGAVGQVAAPSLPRSFRQAMASASLDPDQTPWGAAVGRREPVIVTDVSSDRLWASHRSFASAYGLRAAWSIPAVSTRSDEVVGVLTFHHPEGRAPRLSERRFLEVSGRLVEAVVELAGSRARAAREALRDPLTGLANQALFLDRLTQALARADRKASRMAVVAIDVDHFSSVNNSLGRAGGDRLLQAVAHRLERALRPRDTVARLRADDFVLLCEDLAEEADVLRVVERVSAALAYPFSSGDSEISLSVTLGVALTTGGASPEALVRDAQAALSGARERGRAAYAVHDEMLETRARRHLDTEADLRRAIERDELHIFYQPEVSLQAGRIVGVEALLRWSHPERGLLPPSEFLGLAEATGLIVPIGRWMLERSCREVQTLRATQDDRHQFSLAVNLSARQLLQPDLGGLVEGALSAAGMEPGALCVEVSECVLADHGPVAEPALAALDDLGVKIGIDDFGMGPSSLANLQRYRVSRLKVDRSFVNDLGQPVNSTAIVAAVVGLAHVLGIVVVAEGLETAEQFAELRALGCDLAQGHFFARPRTLEVLRQLLGTTWA